MNPMWLIGIIFLLHLLRDEPGSVNLPELVGIPEPKIGFVGAISSYKLDFALISSCC